MTIDDKAQNGAAHNGAALAEASRDFIREIVAVDLPEFQHR
jgi:hypothetical protein